MNIVARLKYSSELVKLAQMGVDIFLLDTFDLTTKSILPLDIDDFKSIHQSIKKLNKKTYVWINKMIHEPDIIRIEKWMKVFKELVVDGIVVNDFSVYVVAKKFNLEDKIIYQPGTMNTNSYDVVYLQDKVKGMTLSKEITLEEIQKIISQDTQIEFSLIAHGYIDMFYSKRKLISLYLEHKEIDGYQVNNNHYFTLEERTRKGRHYPILEDEKGTHIFRDMKLESFEEVSILKEKLNDIFIERLFLDDQEYEAAIKAYNNDQFVESFMEKYGEEYHHGFYYQVTQKTKGGTI